MCSHVVFISPSVFVPSQLFKIQYALFFVHIEIIFIRKIKQMWLFCMVFIPALPLEDRSRNNVFVRQKLVALTFRIVTGFDEFFGHRITIVFSNNMQ